MKKYIIFSLLFVNLGFGQENNESYLPKIIPNSPNISSQVRYGDIPINLSTGKVNYNIDLFNIDDKNLSLPINLNYNYSGFLVDEDPGYVGYGWNINTNYSITRVLKGKPDDYPLGYLASNFGQNYVKPILNETLSFQEKCNATFASAKGQWDTEPDLFIVTTPYFTTSFMFNTDKKAIFLKGEQYKFFI